MANLLRTPAAWPRILLARADAADPLDLDAAVAAGAFAGLRTAVGSLGPAGTLRAVADARLRGRGGAGYPVADKWRACAAQPVGARCVVANGYGADPASGADHALLELDPYAVVEGLAIAAVAVGATEAWIALRATDTALVGRVETAVARATAAGFVGPDMLGTGRGLDVHVVGVQGAYMLGEETVLLRAIEGRRGQPEQRPPYPAESGLFGRPTVVQNVQTLALVPWILVNGAEAFAATGSAESPGTALVAVRTPAGGGIAEVPLGTPLRAILDLAGKLGGETKLNALLVGGPSGGLLPEKLAKTPYDYAPLREVGAHVGSGSVVGLDDRACVVDLARTLTRFGADSACGKTLPCRIGLRRLSEIGDRVTGGRPQPTDLQLIDDLGHDVRQSALCDHERLATLPLASVMRYFRPELDDHLLRSHCPAGVCHPIAVAGAAAARG